MALTLKEDTFDFYLRFAKPLVLNLTQPDDRVLAAAWIQKLRDESVGDTRLRTDYLKLLLFVLQRNKLIGPFAENPNDHLQLADFPEYKLKDVAKELLESEEQFHKKRAEEGVDGENPPYTSEYSADLLEYAAAQIIPNFGIHAYYAISNEPLPTWRRTEKAIFPRGPASASDLLHTSQPHPVTESLSEPSMASKRVKFKFHQRTIFNSPTYTSPVPQRSHRITPSPPFTSPPRVEGEEERTPPTWGSNLIGVTEPPVLDRTPPSPLLKELMDELGMSVQSSSEDTSPGRNAAVRFSPKRPSPLTLPEGFEDILEEQEPSFMEDFYSPPPLSPSKYPKSYREMISDEFDRLIDDRPQPKSPRANFPVLPEGHRDLFLEDEPSFIEPPPLSPDETWGIADTSGGYFYDEEEPSSPRPQARTPSPAKAPCPASPCLPRPTRGSPVRTPKPREDAEPTAFPFPPVPGFASTSGDDDMEEAESFSPQQPVRTSPTKSPCPVEPCSTRPGTPSPARTPRPYVSPVFPDTPIKRVTYPPRRPQPWEPSPLRPFYTQVLDEEGVFLDDAPSFVESPFSPPPLSPGEVWGVVGPPDDEFSAFDQMLDEFEKEKPQSLQRAIPRRTGIPLPRGSSRIPSASRIPKPGSASTTKIPSRTRPPLGSRIPQPGQKSKLQPPTKRPTPATEVDILFVDDPSLPLRTPSPKRQGKAAQEVSQPRDLLETLGLSSNDLGDLEREREPVAFQEPMEEYTGPVEEVPEEQPQLPRPPLLSGSSPGARDIIESFNRENTVIETDAPREEADWQPGLSQGVYLDDVDFPGEDEYEEMHVSERSPGATREDVSRQLRDIQADYYQMKSTSPADAGVPVTTPRKSPIPKRPLTLYFEDEDRGFSFKVPEYQSPGLHFETPPPYFATSPGSPASPSDFPDEFGLPKPLTFARLQRMKRRTPSPSPPPASRSPRETDILTAAVPQFEFPRQEDPRQRSRSPGSPVGEVPRQTSGSPQSPPQFVPPEWDIANLLTEDADIFEEAFDFPSSPEPIPAEGYGLPVCEGEDDLFAEEAPLDLFDQLLSPGSPRTPTEKRRIPRSPTRLDAVKTRLFEEGSPLSSPESPLALRARLYARPDEPYAPSARASKPPQMHAIREISEVYEDIDIPFLQRVDAARSKIRRRRRKIDMNVSHLGNVAESPIKVPGMDEVEGYLPDLPYPEDLMGSDMYGVAEDQAQRTPFDTTPPRNLPPPISPQSRAIPGWKTPPHLKTAPVKRPPPLLPGMAENIRVPAQTRDILHLEGGPSELAYSPPPISPEEAMQLRSQLPQPQRHFPPPPRTPVRERELLLEEEQEPEYMSPVAASPRTPSPPRPRPQTPESPPESPLALRLRLHRGDAPPYYSRSSMPVVVGKRKVVVKRHSKGPSVHSLREIPDDYPEDEVVFLSKVESSKGKFNKRMRKIKTTRSRLDEIGEIPVEVPNMFEAEDPTGVRYIVEEIERQHADLPQLDRVRYPDDLMGSTVPTTPTKRREYTALDWTPPRNLPSPIRPAANVPGWDSPVRMKTRSGVLPGLAENVRLPKSRRDILEGEIRPDFQFSPPQLTELERAEMRAAYTPRPTAVDRREILEEEGLPDLQLSPPQLTDLEKAEMRAAYASHRAPVEMVDLLDDEYLPEDDMLAESPPPSRREPPESPPEDPLSLHLRLYQANVPERLTRPLEHTDLVVGRRMRRIKRRSDPPKVGTLREISEDLPDEITPFLSRVESAGKLPKKRRRKIRRANLEKKIENEIFFEEPHYVPTMLEVDDPTGFRVMREELENRFRDLPQLPQEAYPEDLLGEGRGGAWETSSSILDMEGPPANLASPLRPRGDVPGWKTPPHLAKVEAKAQSPFRVRLKPEMRDILLREAPPLEMFDFPASPPQYTSPPRRSPSPRGKPSPLLSPVRSYTPPRTFEQIRSAPGLLLDDEMLVEDYFEPDSPFGARSPPRYTQTQRRPAASRWQKPTIGGKYMAREATRDARRLLMEEEEGVPLSAREERAEPATKSASRLPTKKGSTRGIPRPAGGAVPRSARPSARTIPRPTVSARRIPSATGSKKVIRKPAVKEDGIPVPSVTSITKIEKTKEKVKKETIVQDNAWLERIEERIKDVGDPHIPASRPRDVPTFALPEWSPELPQPAEWDSIDLEVEPEDVVYYRSPKTPSPQKMRTPSPKKPPRNIFESEEVEELLDNMMLDDLDLHDGPMTPPTPPRLEDYYEIVDSPDEFEGFAQSLREHKYTPQHYDTRKRMMQARVLQVRNKRVPLKKSMRPRIRTVYETREEVRPERKPRYEVRPQSLNFRSPPKPVPVPMPPRYKYDPYSSRIAYTSPPRFYASPEPLERKPAVVQKPSYDLPRADYYGSPGRQFVRSPFAQRRSPRRALAEADSDMLPVEEDELPNYDADSIVLDADELDGDVAGFQW